MVAMILGRLAWPLAGVAAGAVLVSGIYWYAYQQGAESGRLDALRHSVEILRERNMIDDKISRSDASALCGSYGLSVADQAECVRRVLAVDAKP